MAKKKFSKNQIIAKIAKILGRFRQIEFAYIYGSFLGRRDFLDIDIAMKLRNGKIPKDTLAFCNKVSCTLEESDLVRTHGAGPGGNFKEWTMSIPFNRDIFDVHLLCEMPLSLQHRVISNGKCVLCRDEKQRVRYEEQVLNEFLDFQPAHDWLVQKTLERART